MTHIYSASLCCLIPPPPPPQTSVLIHLTQLCAVNPPTHPPHPSLKLPSCPLFIILMLRHRSGCHVQCFCPSQPTLGSKVRRFVKLTSHQLRTEVTSPTPQYTEKWFGETTKKRKRYFRKREKEHIKSPSNYSILRHGEKKILEGVGRRGQIVRKGMSLHTSAGLS